MITLKSSAFCNIFEVELLSSMIETFILLVQGYNQHPLLPAIRPKVHSCFLVNSFAAAIANLHVLLMLLSNGWQLYLFCVLSLAPQNL